MRKQFHLVMGLFFWLLMVIGFSDNWLFDRGQKSNYNPKFLVHAFFATAWFSMLPIQAWLVRRGQIKKHRVVGVAGVWVFVGFFLSTIAIYATRVFAEGLPSPLSTLNIALFTYATFLFVDAYRFRATNSERHKTDIIVGYFMLMEPGISRSIGHLFGDGSEHIWLSTYLLLFGIFVWNFRKVNWQLAVGFGIWLAGTINIVV